MANRFRAFVERILPWYEPAAERVRNARTERIRRRSIAVRQQAERVIDDYGQAEQERRP